MLSPEFVFAEEIDFLITPGKDESVVGDKAEGDGTWSIVVIPDVGDSSDEPRATGEASGEQSAELPNIPWVTPGAAIPSYKRVTETLQHGGGGLYAFTVKVTAQAARQDIRQNLLYYKTKLVNQIAGMLENTPPTEPRLTPDLETILNEYNAPWCDDWALRIEQELIEGVAKEHVQIGQGRSARSVQIRDLVKIERQYIAYPSGGEHNIVAIYPRNHRPVFGGPYDKLDMVLVFLDPWITITPEVYTEANHDSPTGSGVKPLPPQREIGPEFDPVGIDGMTFRGRLFRARP